MAITRRQFVTRLGALAAAAGFSQVEASKIMEAVAYDPNSGVGAVYQGNFGKPRVVWLHGAECTGCSTSLLGIFENANGIALEGTPTTTAAALTLAGTLPINIPGLNLGTSDFTLTHNHLSPDPDGSMNIADVVIDVIDLLYHETVQGMGADLAFQWLKDFTLTNTLPFVLVVEGAMQESTGGGAWSDPTSAVPWCSIGMDGSILGAQTGKVVYNATTGKWVSGGEFDTPGLVGALAMRPECAAVIAIGQCATFGGYPGCKPPISNATANGFTPTLSQTGATGVHDYLDASTNPLIKAAAAKVANVPGCPTNPWWFILSVVAFMVDLPSVAGGVLPNGTPGTLGVLQAVTPTTTANPLGIAYLGVDNDRRFTAVYGTSVHGPKCPRYYQFVKGVFASKPGDPGCLQKIGCKGPATNSLCGLHGWNNQQPNNPVVWDQGVSHANPSAGNASLFNGGHCPRAGHPCMACTEKGYPDNFVPFVVRS